MGSVARHPHLCRDALSTVNSRIRTCPFSVPRPPGTGPHLRVPERLCGILENHSDSNPNSTSLIYVYQSRTGWLRASGPRLCKGTMTSVPPLRDAHNLH